MNYEEELGENLHPAPKNADSSSVKMFFFLRFLNCALLCRDFESTSQCRKIPIKESVNTQSCTFLMISKGYVVT